MSSKSNNHNPECIKHNKGAAVPALLIYQHSTSAGHNKEQDKGKSNPEHHYKTTRDLIVKRSLLSR